MTPVWTLIVLLSCTHLVNSRPSALVIPPTTSNSTTVSPFSSTTTVPPCTNATTVSSFSDCTTVSSPPSTTPVSPSSPTTTVSPSRVSTTVHHSPNTTFPPSFDTTTVSPSTNSTTTSTSTTESREPGELQPLQVSGFQVTSKVQFRYSRTLVESEVRNPGSSAQLADFAVTIPDSAFISNFSMEVGGEELVARVEEKEKAEETFQRAVSSGLGAGLVSQDARDSNRFTVSANVEPGNKVIFRLTYDELLERKDGMYEQVINIDLKQVVPYFKVEVFINESLPITTINVPGLLQSNEIDFEEETENSIAVVERNVDDDDKKARIVFAPSVEEQKEAEDQRVSGQLVVRYDVDRQGQDSEVQVIDGYFVHYFVPDNLETLSKHVIFVLDTSGSMRGEKIQQLKDSMFTVLDDLKSTDFFNIITFSSSVTHWNSSEPGLDAVAATEDNKAAAIEYVLDLEARGGTNINAALLAGLHLAMEVVTKETLPQEVTSMLVFLSDGEATEGETSSASIKANVAQANSELGLNIFSVAFGRGADFQLLKDISQKSDSFARRVYEDSDAALQLENFYSEISSPQVANLQFDYVGEMVDNSSLSNTELRTFFKGGQYVVVGKLQEVEDGALEVRVTGDVREGRYSDVIQICLRSDQEEVKDAGVSIHRPDHFPCVSPSPQPHRSEAQEFMQSLHAFLHIKQLLQKDEKEAAVRLALDNNLVTPVTSLVVVRPGQEDSLATVSDVEEVAVRRVPGPQFSHFFQSAPVPAFASVRFRSKVGLRGAAAAAPSLQRRKPANPFRNRVYQSDPKPDFPKPYFKFATTTVSYTTTTTTLPSTCSGNLTLHSATYQRGDQVTLQSDSKDLSSFSDRAVSARVQGSCCWVLYSDPDFRGESFRLVPGADYSSAGSFGRRLFRKVSSVQRSLCST